MGGETTLSRGLTGSGSPSGTLVLRLVGDERLARMAAEGDRRAFEVIYERHHQALFRYARTIVGNTEDATDVLQGTMLKAMRGLSHRKESAPLKPWLFRVAHNEAIDVIRRRRPHEELDAVADVSGPAPEHDASVRERLQQLVSDLQELPDRQRGALVMRELSGLDYDEIGTAFGISPAAAKQAVYEARVALNEKDTGRDMDCHEVRKTLSEGDKRMLRGRRVRAHLSACSPCTAFAAALKTRPAELAALAPPLAPAAAAGVLKGIIGGGSGGAGSGGTGVTATALATGTGKVLAGGLAFKAAVIAGATVMGVGAVSAATGNLPAVPGVSHHDSEDFEAVGAASPTRPEEGTADRAISEESKRVEQASTEEEGSGGGDGEGDPGGQHHSGQSDSTSSRGGRRSGRLGGGSGGGGSRDVIGDTIRGVNPPQVPHVDTPQVDVPKVSPPSPPSTPSLPSPPKLP